MRLLVPLFACVLLTAAEPAPPVVPTPPTPPPTEQPPVVKPSFGWTVPDSPAIDGQAPGLAVIEVRPGGTAAALGIEANDQIQRINGAPIRSSDDLRKVLAEAKLGDQVDIEFMRAGVTTSVRGPLLERPRPTNLAGELSAAKGELAALRALATDKAKEPSLAEILHSLQDIDKRLPKAVAAFKKQYPNGEFDLSIRIRITSDKDAKDPIDIGNVAPDAPDAPPIAPVPTPETPVKTPTPTQP